jgi:hypothetical protein
MRRCGRVKSLPPGMISFAFPGSAHRFNNIPRIGHHDYAARLSKVFETNSCRSYLGLLVRSITEIFTHGLPIAFETKHSNSRGTRNSPTVTKARTIAD